MKTLLTQMIYNDDQPVLSTKNSIWEGRYRRENIFKEATQRQYNLSLIDNCPCPDFIGRLAAACSMVREQKFGLVLHAHLG